MLVTDRFDCPARIARFLLCLGTFQHFILIIEHVMPVSGMSLFLSWTRVFPITCRVRARSWTSIKGTQTLGTLLGKLTLAIPSRRTMPMQIVRVWWIHFKFASCFCIPLAFPHTTCYFGMPLFSTILSPHLWILGPSIPWRIVVSSACLQSSNSLLSRLFDLCWYLGSLVWLLTTITPHFKLAPQTC